MEEILRSMVKRYLNNGTELPIIYKKVKDYSVTLGKMQNMRAYTARQMADRILSEEI